MSVEKMFKDAFEGMKSDVEAHINTQKVKALVEIENVAKEIRAAQKARVIELKMPKGKKAKVEGLKHKKFDELVNIAFIRQPMLLVGMAGTGKSQVAEQIAEGFKLPFYSMSVGAQTSKSDIIGYMHAGGGYVSTLFRQAYENGGVFLMDEIDAGNANVLIQINAALANGYCAFPDKMVKKHEDFIFIASANTYGYGANRQYVGRNQLDSATLDRFAIVEFDLDEDLEFSIASQTKHGTTWLQLVRAARKYSDDNQLQVLITPRATIRGSWMLETGMDVERVVDICLLAPFPKDKRGNVKSLVSAGMDAVRENMKSDIEVQAEAVAEELEANEPF